MNIPTISSFGRPRKLDANEKRILRSLMTRKYYDMNQPKSGWKGYRILRRVFVPADFRGDPSVVLLCQLTAKDRTGYFEFCVFSDGLYGIGHHASDKYGAGSMKDALASFEENIFYELFGAWKWVVDERLAEIRKLTQLRK